MTSEVLAADELVTHLSQASRLGTEYWWHAHRFALVLGAIPSGAKSLLDFGCGTGDFLRVAERRFAGSSRQCFGYDPLVGRKQGLSLPEGGEIRLLSASDLDASPGFDVITSLDVLEHIKDDLDALIEIRRCLRPGGRLIGTVPASQRLWSDWDCRLGHYRRYSRAGLTALLVKAGFRPRKVTSAFSYLYPPAYLRKWRRARAGEAEFPPVSPLTNSVLTLLGRIERAVLRHVNLPFGSSIFFVAEPAGEAT